jgi:hypothetical protein
MTFRPRRGMAEKLGLEVLVTEAYPKLQLRDER